MMAQPIQADFGLIFGIGYKYILTSSTFIVSQEFDLKGYFFLLGSERFYLILTDIGIKFCFQLFDGSHIFACLQHFQTQHKVWLVVVVGRGVLEPILWSIPTHVRLMWPFLIKQESGVPLCHAPNSLIIENLVNRSGATTIILDYFVLRLHNTFLWRKGGCIIYFVKLQSKTLVKKTRS